MLKYSKDHEWILVEGNIATIGISDHAQTALGDVVFIELPDVGRELSQGDDAAVVESVKAASEVYAPVSGTVTERNDALEATPDTVNASPMGDGWFFRVELSNPDELDELMDEAGYLEFLKELD